MINKICSKCEECGQIDDFFKFIKISTKFKGKLFCSLAYENFFENDLNDTGKNFKDLIIDENFEEPENCPYKLEHIVSKS